MQSARLVIAGLATVIASLGCTTFSLSEQTGVLPIAKNRRASDATLYVMPSSYTPEDAEDIDDLTPADLESWQQLLVSGIDQSNIFASVEHADTSDDLDPSHYILTGRITRFRFQKNWVPTFFPLHLALSFFTFTGYTLFGGPTTTTIVRFTVNFELKSAESGVEIVSFSENYRSTRAVNIYSKGAENPYDNPNMVFAKIIQDAATRIAAVLP